MAPITTTCGEARGAVPPSSPAPSSSAPSLPASLTSCARTAKSRGDQACHSNSSCHTPEASCKAWQLLHAPCALALPREAAAARPGRPCTLASAPRCASPSRAGPSRAWGRWRRFHLHAAEANVDKWDTKHGTLQQVGLNTQHNTTRAGLHTRFLDTCAQPAKAGLTDEHDAGRQLARLVKQLTQLGLALAAHAAHNLGRRHLGADIGVSQTHAVTVPYGIAECNLQALD